MSSISSSTAAVPLRAPLPGASIGQAFSRFWRKYATFSGRASRSEYWWWYLIAAVVNGLLSSLGRTDGAAGDVFRLLSGVWGLAILVPTLALLWRRLHDTNRSGLWALAPIVLWAAAAVFLLVGTFVLAASSPTADTAQATLGGGLLVVAVLLLLVGAVITLMLTLLPSNPAGARFDRP